jgi:hypothetical protein
MASFRVGRNVKRGATNEQAIRGFLDAFSAIAIENRVIDIQEQGSAIAARMQAAGQRELERLPAFMSDSLFGLASKGRRASSTRAFRRAYGPSQDDLAGSDRQISEKLFMRGAPIAATNRGFLNLGRRPIAGVVRWKTLSLKTEKRKGNSQFFVDQGVLQAAFRSAGMVDRILNKTGGIRVEFDRDDVPPPPGGRSNTFKEVVGALKIHILPSVRPGQLPQLAAGRWDAAGNYKATLERGFFTPDIAKRLGASQKRGNVPTWFRPSFQPTLAFWALHRIPRAMASALAAEVRFQKGKTKV